MAEFVGIDFGTTNSVVARLVEEPTRVDLQVVPSALGANRTPSAVAVSAQQTEWLFGEAAREANTPYKVLSVKRVLGSDRTIELAGRHWRTEAVASLLMRYLITQAQRRIGAPIESAVITVPANSKGLQRNATKLAAMAAGVRVLNLINEPTAAAMAYGLGQAAAGGGSGALRVLVYDFGGGTLDVTLLRAHHGIFEEVTSHGLGRCGGDDLDEALADHLRATVLAEHVEALHEPYADLRLRLACEQAKIALTDAGEARIDVEDLLPGVSVHETIDRATFVDLIRPIIERTADPVRAVLSGAGIDASELDRVLLVGGTSRVPFVRDFVESLLDREAEPFDQIDPMTCVAEGAAIVAGILGSAPHMDDYDYQVCLEHSLCTDPVDVMTGRKYLEPLIEHGTKIPNQNTSVYLPVVDYAKEVVVNIYEGNVYDDPLDDENVRIGEVRVKLDPPRRAEQCPVQVQFEYSEDGILTARAKDITQNRSFARVIDYSSGHLNDDENARIRALLTKVFGEAPPVVLPAVPEPEPAAAAANGAAPGAAAGAAAGGAARTLHAPAPGAPAAVREAYDRLQKADRVLTQIGGTTEASQLRGLRDRVAAALDGVTPVSELQQVDQQLAAELLFFDYLL